MAKKRSLLLYTGYVHSIHNTSSMRTLRKQCDQMSNGTVPFHTVGAMMRVSQRARHTTVMGVMLHCLLLQSLVVRESCSMDTITEKKNTKADCKSFVSCPLDSNTVAKIQGGSKKVSC